jgi:hypothetical protein
MRKLAKHCPSCRATRTATATNAATASLTKAVPETPGTFWARWADWQPTWFPDWSQPRLSGFRQAIHLAGMLARQVAPRLALQPDLAEAAARIAGIGHLLIAAKKVGRRTPGGGWIRLAAHWSLPPSLRQIWSRLDAPLAFFTRQDSEEKLLRLVQVVWQLAQGRFRLKSAWSGPPLSDLLATLELDAGDFPCDQVPSCHRFRRLAPIGCGRTGRLSKETVSARQQLQFVERECSAGSDRRSSWPSNSRNAPATQTAFAGRFRCRSRTRTRQSPRSHFRLCRAIAASGKATRTHSGSGAYPGADPPDSCARFRPDVFRSSAGTEKASLAAGPIASPGRWPVRLRSGAKANHAELHLPRPGDFDGCGRFAFADRHRMPASQRSRSSAARWSS